LDQQRDARALIPVVRQVYRAGATRRKTPECALGFDWRVDELLQRVVLLVHDVLHDDVRAALDRESVCVDIVFRPYRHEEHDVDVTRVSSDSEARARVACALNALEIPREYCDATVRSLSARLIDQDVTIVVTCTHPGYAMLDRLAPHHVLTSLGAHVLYVHAAPTVADLERDDADACVVV